MKKLVGAILILAPAAFTYALMPDFFELVKSGTTQNVQAAIDKGADVNAHDNHGRTPLFLAAANNKNPVVITTLLKAGADIKARDKDGRTALMGAASFNQNPSVITTLLKAGADIKAQSKGGATALMRAAMHNQNPEVITTLLKAGAYAKVKDNAGKTAFDYAKGNAKLKGTDALKQLEEASK
jgi:ankyrin repeat protein